MGASFLISSSGADDSELVSESESMIAGGMKQLYDGRMLKHESTGSWTFGNLAGGSGYHRKVQSKRRSTCD
jgi:hypothetical protein